MRGAIAAQKNRAEVIKTESWTRLEGRKGLLGKITRSIREVIPNLGPQLRQKPTGKLVFTEKRQRINAPLASMNGRPPLMKERTG